MYTVGHKTGPSFKGLKKGAFNLHYITRSKPAAIKFLFEKIILCVHLFDFYFTALKIYFLQLYETTIY